MRALLEALCRSLISSGSPPATTIFLVCAHSGRIRIEKNIAKRRIDISSVREILSHSCGSPPREGLHAALWCRTLPDFAERQHDTTKGMPVYQVKVQPQWYSAMVERGVLERLLQFVPGRAG